MTTDLHGLGRRRALVGAAGISLGLPVLAACGGEEQSATDPGGSTPDDGAASSEGDGGGGTALGPTSDVPVGSGTIYADAKVVVTQPSEGEFKAFTAVCTHQGCLVGQVEGEEILCPCHGSVFSTADGSVLDGPATSPLEEVAVTVDGDQITLA